MKTGGKVFWERNVKKFCFADAGGNIEAITNYESMEKDVATPWLLPVWVVVVLQRCRR
jgi:hypothetical protein